MAEFFDITEDDIKTKLNASEKFLKLENGDQVLRIMPPWKKGALFSKSFFVHFSLGRLTKYGLEAEWNAEACLDDGAGGVCPICALSVRARSAGERLLTSAGTEDEGQELIDLANKIRRKTQFVMNVVDITNDPNSVRVLQCGKKLHDQIKAFFTRKGNISHPEKGYDIVVTKSEVGGFPNYSASLDDRIDRLNLWNDSWSSQLHDLDTLPNRSTLEVVEAKLEGIEFMPINKSARASKPTNVGGEDCRTDSMPSADPSGDIDDLIRELEEV